jgi:predicted DNA-binding transcriptional regulator YafY
MRRADRLIELVRHLRQDKLVTADELAGLLEVAVRTVYRDIAALQGQGFPIEGQAGLGYILRGPINLPAMTFDHDQLEALALGLAYVVEVGDPALAAAARAARAKIDATWTGPTLAVSDRQLRAHQRPERKAPAFAASLRRALRGRRLVAFRYRGEEEHESERVVRPLALTAFSEGWFLVAWCNLRDNFRIFRLNRMTQGAVLDETFQDEQGKDLPAFLAQRNVASRDSGYAASLKGGQRRQIYAVCVDLAARRRKPRIAAG